MVGVDWEFRETFANQQEKWPIRGPPIDPPPNVSGTDP